MKKLNSERVYLYIMYSIVGVFTFFCFLPFWVIFISSFTAESSIIKNGITIFPEEFSLAAYKFIFKGRQIYISYRNTIIVSTLGTVIAMFVSTTFAYVLAHPRVRYRNILAFATYFTMIFGKGLVGFYILMSTWLHLKDTIWALILPYVIHPFYIFILVAFFRAIPHEINDAATIDGANEFRIFFTIICPLAIPAIAAVSLFYALLYWNDWWLALLFIDDYKLHPLQVMIRQIYSMMHAAAYAGSGSELEGGMPSYGVRFATVCLVIGPIIFVYPFIQKYFMKGLTLGALKG